MQIKQRQGLEVGEDGEVAVEEKDGGLVVEEHTHTTPRLHRTVQNQNQGPLPTRALLLGDRDSGQV